MDWGRDMPQRLDWLEKAWLPRLIVGGAWLKQQDTLRPCKPWDEGSPSRAQQHD